MGKKKFFYFLLIVTMFMTGCQKAKENMHLNLENALEKSTIRPINSLQQPLGLLQFSSDGRYLAVSSSSEGVLRIVGVQSQKVLKEWHLGIGRFTTVAFSTDSNYLYLGEHSPDGYLYCLSLPEGRKVWQYRLAQDTGVNLQNKSYPIVNDIVLDTKGILYFVGGRIEKKEQDQYEYRFRVHALEAETGVPLWQFPKRENLDISSYVLAVDRLGEQLLLNTNSLNNSQKTKYEVGTVYALAAEKGQLQWQHLFPKKDVFQQARTWQNIALSADSKHIGVISHDGRGYLLDGRGNLLWEKTLAVLKDINGILLHASGRKCYFVQDQILFSTSNTSELGKGRADMPLEHPNCNTVFCYDLQGNLLWRWKGGGLLNEQRFTDDGTYMVCSVGNNSTTRDLKAHGVYLLNIGQRKVTVEKIYRSATGGPMVAADISPDGKYIAGLETPILLEDGVTTVGKYQLHIWKR